MARPIKKGLDYYPMDVDVHDDDKVALLSSTYGAVGEAVLWRLFSRIYKNGYFYEWGPDECMLFCRWAGGIFTAAQVSEILDACLARAIFDAGIYATHGVLTSRGIQRRFLQAVKERMEVEIYEDFWLLDIPHTSRFTIIEAKNPIIPEDNTQSKVKHSKAKQSKAAATPAAQTTELDYAFIEPEYKTAFMLWVEEKVRRRQAYKTQVTLEACYRNLKRLALENPETASSIVDRSLSNNWMGLHELDDGNGRKFAGKSQADTGQQQRHDFISREAGAAVRELRGKPA